MRIKKPKNPDVRKTKLERIMDERNIAMIDLHEQTGLSNPLLFDIYFGRRTEVAEFEKRSLRDLEDCLGLPPEKFLGWEDESITKAIRDLIDKKD